MKSLLKALFFSFLLTASSFSLAGNLQEGTRLFEAEKYRAAMTCLMKSDAQTDPEAMNMIGFMYNRGLGIQKIRKKRSNGIGKRLKPDYPLHNSISGSCISMAVQKDIPEAVKWYRLAAEHGDNSAYVDIGILYARGRGVKKDPNRAVQYYIMGAQKDEPDAQALLGTSYALGTGITQDNEKALYWYRKAAENGSIEAMKELGYIYETGRLGVKKDLDEAERWNAMARKAEELERN